MYIDIDTGVIETAGMYKMNWNKLVSDGVSCTYGIIK